MISFDDALQNARKRSPQIDSCAEYEDAYVFSKASEKFDIGGSGPVVVLKANGKVLNMVSYTDKSSSKFLRELLV